MLPRARRLPGNRIAAVLGGQNVFIDRDFLIKAAVNGLGLSRLAVIIPAKVYRRAVDRNRLKRRLMAILAAAPVTPGWDAAILIRRQGV